MNVQERLLQERIDPYLSDEALTRMAGCALERADAAAGMAGDAGSAGGTGAGECADGSSARHAVSGFEILTGGCWNRVIGVTAGTRELVCKISPHPADERIIREYEVLSTFAAETELPVPRPLCLDSDGSVFPGTTLVMTRLPGVVMHECFGMLGRSDRERIIDRIASDLSELHTRRSRGFGGVELPPEERTDSWPEFWLPRFDTVIREAAESGNVPGALLEQARELRPHVAPFLEIGPESTMTHYDIWAGNVMVDIEANPPELSGYIDVPGFYADYARELSFAMLFGVAERRFFERYLQAHTLDDGFWLRANIYNLKMNIKHIEMYPGASVYLHGAQGNLKAIREAL